MAFIDMYNNNIDIIDKKINQLMYTIDGNIMNSYPHIKQITPADFIIHFAGCHNINFNNLMNKIEKNNIFKINWENNICTINLDSNHFESPWENCILFKYNNNIYKGTFCNIEHYFYIDQINKLVHILEIVLY